jgi:hypothetical protein
MLFAAVLLSLIGIVGFFSYRQCFLSQSQSSRIAERDELPELSTQVPTYQSANSKVAPVASLGSLKPSAKKKVSFKDSDEVIFKVADEDASNSPPSIPRMSATNSKKYFSMKDKSLDDLWEDYAESQKSSTTAIDMETIPSLEFLRTVPSFISEILVKTVPFDQIPAPVLDQTNKFPFLKINQITAFPADAIISSAFFVKRGVKKIKYEPVQGDLETLFKSFSRLQGIDILDEVSVDIINPVRSNSVAPNKISGKLTSLNLTVKEDRFKESFKSANEGILGLVEQFLFLVGSETPLKFTLI